MSGSLQYFQTFDFNLTVKKSQFVYRLTIATIFTQEGMQEHLNEIELCIEDIDCNVNSSFGDKRFAPFFFFRVSPVNWLVLHQTTTASRYLKRMRISE